MIGRLIPLEPHDGSRYFVPRERIAPEPPLLGGFPDDEDGRRRLWGWTCERFRRSVVFKRPETERLKLCELYYAGFHYLTPQENRAYKVTNLCFSTVETVHPVLTETRPRPEIAPRAYTAPEVAAQQQAAAEWWMDNTEFDLANHLVCRDKLKYGWGLWGLFPDPASGITRPRAVPVWDFYPQAGARCDEDMDHFFIATPVSTERLRTLFPDAADRIQPDGIASAGYDVLERPYQEAYTTVGGYDTIETRVADHAKFEGGTTPEGTASFVPDGSSTTEWDTTFLIQMFVRDHTMLEVRYMGDLATRDPMSDAGTYQYAAHPEAMVHHEPVNSNGWRLIQFAADGTFLGSEMLDECFDEPPFYRDMDYQQNGRYWPVGELDNIIPINRSINERYNNLNHSLRYEVNPILLADIDTGIDIDRAAVGPGDVLKKLRGSSIEWLDFRGAQAGQFELLGQEKLDIDTVSGVQDASRGRRPVGVEAAAAIEALRETSQGRIRGKEVPMFIALAKVLKAGLIATGRKIKTPILTRGVGGVIKSIDPSALRNEFDVRFVQGSGTAVGMAMRRDETSNLLSQGLIDPVTALERMAIPGGAVIAQRLASMPQPQPSTEGAA